MNIGQVKKGNTYAYRRSMERASAWRGRPLNTSWTEVEVIDVLPAAEADAKYGKPTKFSNTFYHEAHTKPWLPRIEGSSQAGPKTKVIVGRQIATVSIHPNTGKGEANGSRVAVENDRGLMAFDARGMMGEAEAMWAEKFAQCEAFAKRGKETSEHNDAVKARRQEVAVLLVNAGIKADIAVKGDRFGGKDRNMLVVSFRGDEEVDALLARLGLTVEV